MNFIKNNPQSLIIFTLLGLLAFQYFFLGDSYKKEYQKLLKEQEQKYEQEIKSLHGSNDSILKLNAQIENKIAKIDKDIAKKEAELAKLKKQNAQNIAKLNAMSDADLSSTFTELFN